MTMKLRLLLMGGVLLALGCDAEFDPDYQLKKARVLALQAEPPQPQVGASTTLRALLYLPDQEAPSYRWSWCPAPTVAENGFACPIDQAGFEAFLGLPAGQAPSLDLGTGETAVLTNIFAPDMLAKLCAGQLDGASADVGADVGLWTCASAGFPITVRMEFQTPAMAQADPNHWLPSVFKIFLPTDATQPGNQNPVLGSLATIAPEPGQELDDAASATLARNLEYKLRLAMEASVSETFRGWTRDSLGGFVKDTNNNYVIGQVQEIINLKWYVEGGDLGNDTVEGDDTGLNPYASIPQPLTNATDNFWKTPKLDDYPKERARIIVVARDDRGGVGWTSAAVTLGAQP
jgi:hypothetical protein